MEKIIKIIGPSYSQILHLADELGIEAKHTIADSPIPLQGHDIGTPLIVVGYSILSEPTRQAIDRLEAVGTRILHTE